MAFLLANWRLVAEAVVIGILLIGISVLTIQKNHYKADRDRIEAQFGAFKDQVSRLGKEAEAKAKAQEAANEARIAAARKDAAAARGALAEWVSKYNSGRGFVPSLPDRPRGTCPESQVCFDAAGFDEAMGRGRGIAAEGQQAVIDRRELTDAWPK